MNETLKIILKSIFYFCIYLALMALGWGFGDLRGFFDNPGRVGVVIILGGQALFRVARSFIPERAAHHRLEHIGIYRLQLMAMETAFVIAPFCDRRGLTVMVEGVRWWGLALMAAGTLLAAWAILTWPPRFILVDTVNELSPEHSLSSSFGRGENPRAAASQDFCCGPFRWLRYPYFLGQALIAAGIGLAFRSWAGLVIGLLLLVVAMVRTYQMDEIDLSYFGSAWAEYVERTKRVIPFIY